MKAWFQFRLYERRFRESSPDGLSIRLGSMQMRNLRLHLLEQARQNQLRYAAMSLRIGMDAVRQESFVPEDVDPSGVDIDQISVGFESNAADGSRVAETHTDLVDVYAAWIHILGYERFLPDGVHPN